MNYYYYYFTLFHSPQEIVASTYHSCLLEIRATFNSFSLINGQASIC